MDDDFDDDEDEEVDQYDDEEPTVRCRYCGEWIHEESPRCPRCGEYISTEDQPAGRKPWWIVVGALAVMYMVYRWTVG